MIVLKYVFDFPVEYRLNYVILFDTHWYRGFIFATCFK